MGTYLGLDSSTQSLSALIIDTDKGCVVHESTVNFGEDLPQFQCPRGFIENDDPLVRHADPLMWAAALDLLFTRLVDQGVALSEISGISGSGQQHGTVYLSGSFNQGIDLNGVTRLADAVRPILTRSSSPIWMDSSTTAQCRDIDSALGGAEAVRSRSGSSAIERFAGPQIRKFYRQEPAAYERTGAIHLVSSFLCSLLIGRPAAIDYGDGAGMNLLNLADGDWDDALLAATAADLRRRLPAAAASNTVAGIIHPYFQVKYGFNANTPVVLWSGDNPNSLIGVGGWKPGVAVISLGTSDTLFAAMQKPVVDPDGYGHVFGNPAGGFMCLICFKNGSLAREQVKETHGLSWQQFDVEAFAETLPGNGGNMMLPYFVSEITPLVLHAGPIYRGDEEFIQGKDAFASVRAIVEAQALSMRAHSGWIGEDPDVVRVTGGASRSPGICQVLANVFNARVERLKTANSAALGAAMRAANGAGGLRWDELTDAFCASVHGKNVEPQADVVPIYRDMLAAYISFEQQNVS